MKLSENYVKQITDLYLNKNELFFSREAKLIEYFLKYSDQPDNVELHPLIEKNTINPSFMQTIENIKKSSKLTTILRIGEDTYMVICTTQNDEVELDIIIDERIDDIFFTRTLEPQEASNVINDNLASFLHLYYFHNHVLYMQGDEVI
ncbi:MAG: hypothetical protein ABS904_00080 [Solibacillus isronensis]